MWKLSETEGFKWSIVNDQLLMKVETPKGVSTFDVFIGGYLRLGSLDYRGA